MTSVTTPETTLDPPPPPLDPQPVRVILADDHPLFRQGIARSLQRHPQIELVGEAANGRQALELIDALQPDVAVLDQRMPELTGTDVCAALQARAEPPVTATLLLSAFEDAELVWSAVDYGAAGYVGKTASQQEICDAIVRIGRGGIAFTEHTAAVVTEGFARRSWRDPAA